jgi:hypothetical protein
MWKTNKNRRWHGVVSLFAAVGTKRNLRKFSLRQPRRYSTAPDGSHGQFCNVHAGVGLQLKIIDGRILYTNECAVLKSVLGFGDPDVCV